MKNIARKYGNDENTIGIVSSSLVKIYRDATNITIPLELIKKTFLYKRKKYHKNYLFFFCALVLTFAVDYLFFKTTASLIFFQVLTAFVIALVIKDYEYKLLIVKEFDFIELKIDEATLEDAVELIQLINKNKPLVENKVNNNKAKTNLTIKSKSLVTNFVSDEYNRDQLETNSLL
mgnify:CR=1 FL=1